MKRIVVLFVLCTALIALQNNTAKGQDRTIYEKQIYNKKPVPYAHLREADVMWSKQIWRMVDLRQKKNHVLFYPEIPLGDRKSLIDIILGEVEAGNLNAWDADVPDAEAMTVPATQEAIDIKFDAVERTTQVPDPNNPNLLRDTTYKDPIVSSDVKQYLVKEEWYFDKKHSSMQVRIIGICPIRHTVENGALTKRKVCWIYFPDFRNTFAQHEIFNRYNDANRISYDDFFMQRRFDSYIIAESNVYNNREVSQYKTGREALLEAEKIKVWLMEMEHDMWEY
ncbi:MAG: gliding motility protein GldN [Bacteroidales bacterium]|nr:MAG: gliding motility protein GldN [Bacteroidales bacterium]